MMKRIQGKNVMIFPIKNPWAKVILFALSGYGMPASFAHASTNDHLVLQVGGFAATQGKAQDVGINTVLGDHYTVEPVYDKSMLLGIGYYFNGLDENKFALTYGVDAFYLAPTQVQGNIIQEQTYTNLSYRYAITNYPIYAAVKVLIKNSDAYNTTFDLGVGPNFIKTSTLSMRSLDGGVTQPEDSFSGKTDAAFSTMAGVGMRFNHLLSHAPLEIGYRFFYLGQGKLNKLNSQYNNSLMTGHSYANALLLSVAF